VSGAVQKGLPVAKRSGLSSVAGLLPLLLGSALVALLASAAGPSPEEWSFQSPISPVGPGAAGSPSAPTATITGPGLVSVPTPPNFVPWIIGILVIAAIVGAALMWRRADGEGGREE
jgi:hypothetical protein